MLNIVGHGMGGRPDVEQNTKDMDPVKTAEVARRNHDVVVGIKVAHYAGPEWIAVDRGVEAGKLANIPVMVDFATFRPERPFQELVLKHLRPGDIYTHQYLTAVPMLDAQNHVLPYLFEARKRGIIFDVGHGGGSFSLRQAIPAVKQGFIPDSISTDLHIDSMNAGMKDMLNVMSKFLNMGMSLDDVIACSTWHPAREIHHEELGTLSVGAGADVAVLRLVHGDFGFVDSGRLRMKGDRKLVAEMTLRDGRVVWDLNGMSARTGNMPNDISRRGLLTLAAAGLASAKDKRLIIDTHLEVWTDDPKFPFHHPEHPELKRVPVQAPIENEVAEMREFGLKYAVLINPAVLRLGQLLHQLFAPQVSAAFRRARIARSAGAGPRRTPALLGQGARLSRHALQPASTIPIPPG